MLTVEFWRLMISAVGFAVAVWGLWDAVIDLAALYGLEIRGLFLHRIRAAWRAELDRRLRERNGSLRIGAWYAVQRAAGRAIVIGIQLILSVSAMLDGTRGADWKLYAQMAGVLVLSLNAVSDRTERRLYTGLHAARKTRDA